MNSENTAAIHIETERLIMRDLIPSDDADMFELDSDMEVHKYIGMNPVTSIDQSRNVIAIIRQQYITNGIGRWALVEKNTGNFIGWGGLKLIIEPIGGRSNYYDLGYRLIKKYWGKGYATEQALAIVQYAWHTLKLNELSGIANIENLASRMVLEKIGMKSGTTFIHEGIKHVWYKLQKND